MDHIDYYLILELSHTATQVEIRRQYRRLALMHHPDLFTDAVEKARATQRMAQINEAYHVLGDPVRRSAYDRMRGSYRQYGYGPASEWHSTSQQAQQAYYYGAESRSRYAAARKKRPKRVFLMDQAWRFLALLGVGAGLVMLTAYVAVPLWDRSILVRAAYYIIVSLIYAAVGIVPGYWMLMQGAMLPYKPIVAVGSGGALLCGMVANAAIVSNTVSLTVEWIHTPVGMMTQLGFLPGLAGALIVKGWGRYLYRSKA